MLSATERDRALRERQLKISAKKKEQSLSIALVEGVKYGSLSSLTFGGISYFMTKYSPIFDKSMSISAKVSLPVMAGLFAFGFTAERTMNSINLDPESWGIYANELEKEIVDQHTIPDKHIHQDTFQVPAHHLIANRIYGKCYFFIF
jgi:hypothetical protein